MFSTELEMVLPHLRAFARSLCHNATLADDLVQDTCLKAWDARDRFDPAKGTLKAWLFRILRNEFYQKKRRSWRTVHTEASELERSLTMECGLETSSDLQRMMRAIYALKDAQRDAFILIVAAGFTYDEAGQICDCSEGTIKSRVNRARERILAMYNTDAPIVHTNPDVDACLQESPLDIIHEHIDEMRYRRSAA